MSPTGPLPSPVGSLICPGGHHALAPGLETPACASRHHWLVARSEGGDSCLSARVTGSGGREGGKANDCCRRNFCIPLASLTLQPPLAEYSLPISHHKLITVDRCIPSLSLSSYGKVVESHSWKIKKSNPHQRNLTPARSQGGTKTSR